MKKKTKIIIIVIVLLLVLAIVYYFIPKTFGKNVNPSEVDHIEVFNGNDGVGFTITNPEDIKYIVENIQSYSMKRDGISLGRMGYGFRIRYLDRNENEVVSEFILNSENVIRKDPFFYVCEGGLAFDFMEKCEEKSATTKE